MFGLQDGLHAGGYALIVAGLVIIASSDEGQAQQGWQVSIGSAGGSAAEVDDILAKQQLLNMSRTSGPSTAAPVSREPKLTPALAPNPAVDRAGKPASAVVAALPSGSLPLATPVAKPVQGKAKLAQFVPNAVATPKRIVQPRLGEKTGRRPDADTNFKLSSRKSYRGQAPALQQAVLAPNVAKSSKTAVLRRGAAPDNQLVELVETASDEALALSAGRGQLLNLGSAVTDVFVADPEIADVRVVSPRKLFVHGNKLGRTNIFGIGAGGDVVFGLDLQVVPDAGLAQAQLKALAPNSKADIQLVSDRLIAKGAVNGIGEAIQLAALTDQLAATQGPISNNTRISGSQQVNLRVRFAEVSRNDVVNLGVNWNALGNTGDFLIGLSSGPDIGDLAGLAADLAGNAATSGGIPGTGDVNVEAFIDALQQEGIISLLAEPNLTAINGERGEFLAGSEIPILVPGGGGDGTTTIEYKQVGVSLEYIPTLLPGNRINLRIRPEVSSPSPSGGVIIDGFAIPAFSVRRAETSVELASGQTMALAGLFQRDISTDVSKFPILGDLPILGKLFRSERYQRSETELVILITPYLVKPTSRPNIALPNERIDLAKKPLVQKNRRRAGFILN